MSTALSEKQFDAVVGAILDGKYSLACVLVLEAAGHDPSDYMPRRTYTRLKRECRQQIQQENYPIHAGSPRPLYQLSQVDFLESCSQDKRGGFRHLARPSSQRLKAFLSQAKQGILSRLG